MAYKTAVASGYDHVVWDLDLDKPVFRWRSTTNYQDDQQPRGFALSADGKTVVNTYLDTDRHEYLLSCWRLPEGECMDSLRLATNLPDPGPGKDPDPKPVAFAFRPDGRQFVMLNLSKRKTQLELRHTKSLQLVRRLPYQCQRFAMSHNGEFVAVAARDQLHVVDLETGAAVLRLSGRYAHFVGLAFSHNDQLLATTDSRGELRLWELATGTTYLRLQDPHVDLGKVAFISGMKQVITEASNGTAIVWSIAPHPSEPVTSLDQFDKHWEQLASPDARVGMETITRLAAAPRLTLTELEKRLVPATEDVVALQIKLLDSDRFADREAASDKLRGYGYLGALRLRVEAKQAYSFEVRARLRRILNEFTKGSDSARVSEFALLRTCRVIRLLERIGDEQARELLSRLASGHPTAVRTKYAGQSLIRLSNNSVGR